MEGSGCDIMLYLSGQPRRSKSLNGGPGQVMKEFSSPVVQSSVGLYLIGVSIWCRALT